MPYANNNGVSIHYDIEGKGPPLMMVPTIARSLDYWHDIGLAQELRKDYRLILMDMRGHGMSDKPRDTKAYQWQLLVSDLVAVLDDLNIEKAHYLGGDWGGRIGFFIPLYAPERFHSIILRNATYPIRGRVDVNMERYIELYRELLRLMDLPLDKMLSQYHDFRSSLGSPDTPTMRTRFLLNDPDAIMAILWAMQEESFPDAADVLPRMTLPTLIIVGENDSRYPIARENVKLMPNATLVPLPGFDFFQASRRVDTLAPNIKKFLAEVERKIASQRT